LRCNAYEPPFDDGYYYLAPVGAFSPAGDSCFGVCDMMGSLWEWCEDFYAEDYYAVSPVNDPQGPGTGLARSTRGGSFASPFEHCRSAERVGYNPWATTVVLGFRLLVPTTQ
jgi:formylglycine-generating enzyme required for sulfatase activity